MTRGPHPPAPPGRESFAESAPLDSPNFPALGPLCPTDTKGLYFQMFSGRRHFVSKTVAPLLSHGYRKFLPTKDHVFILDYNGTLFFLKNALVSSTMGHVQWRRACRYMVLCRSAKDVRASEAQGLPAPSKMAGKQNPLDVSWHARCRGSAVLVGREPSWPFEIGNPLLPPSWFLVSPEPRTVKLWLEKRSA